MLYSSKFVRFDDQKLQSHSMPRQGKIGLFGGHREEGETYLECVVREIYEEISYFISPDRFQHLVSYNGTEFDADGDISVGVLAQSAAKIIILVDPWPSPDTVRWLAPSSSTPEVVFCFSSVMKFPASHNSRRYLAATAAAVRIRFQVRPSPCLQSQACVTWVARSA